MVPHPARHWRRLPDGRLQCDVCPRECRLADGQRGLCFVRARAGDQLVLDTWGRSSGFCVDPIEKKPLNHFLPGTPVLSFGTAGCNLTCRFCQNWDISKSREVDTLADAALPDTIARAAADLGCRSVAFTYNDPVIFLEYAVDTARACREVGVATVAVTAGYVCPEARRDFFAEIDAANVDLKGFSEDFYRELCTGELAPVLDTLVYLRHETDVWLEITTLLIPGQNDSPAELEALSAWVAENLGPDVPLHFTAFHPDFRMLDTPATPPSTLRRARDIAKRAGIRHVYTGNVHDRDGQSTWCHGCGQRVIGRDWYVLSDWELDDEGRCRSCGTRCPGVFDGPPGTWGAKRRPVRLAAYAAQK
ncbi:MAG: AmmeMemoRadiSam system radical SAM enzyme [Myxococcota bacterium]|nr:AmmeMemoRadiSam system radical SAM enzyme [Myxococcota bacterium]